MDEQRTFGTQRTIVSYGGGICGRKVGSKEMEIAEAMLARGVESVPLVRGLHAPQLGRRDSEAYVWFIEGQSLFPEANPNNPYGDQGAALYDLGKVEGELFSKGIKIRVGEDTGRLAHFIREDSTGRVYLVDIDQRAHVVEDVPTMPSIHGMMCGHILEFLADTYVKFNGGYMAGGMSGDEYMTKETLMDYLRGFYESYTGDNANGAVGLLELRDRIVRYVDNVKVVDVPLPRGCEGNQATTGIFDRIHERHGIVSSPELARSVAARRTPLSAAARRFYESGG
jgi:hypothetical protein